MTKQAKGSSSQPAQLDPAAEQIAEHRQLMVGRLHRSYLNLENEMRALQAAWDARPQAAFVSAAAAGWQLGAHWRDADAALFDAPFWEGIAPIDVAAVTAEPANPGTLAAERLVRLRDPILALPSLLAAGDPATISKQLDVVLNGFDAGYAEEIFGHKHYAIILDLIKHDESVLTYMAYVGLMITTVPPNFYAFVAGKGAPCLMLEAVLLATSALVSGDNATAARMWELEERFDDLDVDDTSDSEALNIDGAVDALVRMLHDFRRAADDVHELCSDFSAAQRAGGVQMPIAEKMAAIVADTSCRDCGSRTHTTTLSRMGTVRYE